MKYESFNDAVNHAVKLSSNEHGNVLTEWVVVDVGFAGQPDYRVWSTKTLYEQQHSDDFPCYELLARAKDGRLIETWQSQTGESPMKPRLRDPGIGAHMSAMAKWRRGETPK